MACPAYCSLPLQRRREAYRRYCKLRDRGKLKDGSNPPLSAADTMSPAASRAVEKDAAAWAENGEASLAAAMAGAVQEGAAVQAAVQAGAAAAAAAAGQKQPRGQRWRDTWSLCFRGAQEQAQQVRGLRGCWC